MRKILDGLFENKKLSFWLPIILASVIYLLLLLFYQGDDKINLMIITPILSVIWLFGSFAILLIQVKNSKCSDDLLDVFELFALAIFVGSSIFDVVSFVFSGFQNFSPVVCAGLITYSSISWAHNKRPKNGNE